MPTQTSQPTLEQFREALAAQLHDVALNIVRAWGRLVPGDALVPAADLLLRAGEWAPAARLLNRVIDPPPPVQLRQRLARNMAAVQKHRPDLFALLAATPITGRYDIVQCPSGALTLIDKRPIGSAQPVVLSMGGDPAVGLAAPLKQLDKPIREGLSIALDSVGDGYLLHHLAANPPKLLLTRTQCVHVVEPEPELLLAAFTLHDYTGPAGPIEQRRFIFHVGPDWASRFEAALGADLMLPPPRTCITQRAGDEFKQVAAAVERRHIARRAALERSAADYYRGLTPADLAARFAAGGRALLLTSRFTTVLQHSARDAAAALRELGWQAELLIEPDDHHWVMELAIAEAVDRFKPDLVFTIDHLRYEMPGRFPPQLPFVCWVQDQLSNLTSRAAGASITPRDFVLTAVAPMYANAFDYPPRQMIDLPQLTRVPTPPSPEAGELQLPGAPPPSTTPDDLAYVSNAPPPVEAVIEQTIDDAGRSRFGPLVEACCRQLVALYDRGQNLPTLWHMGRLVDHVARQLSFTLDPIWRINIINHLTHPLNNALYRRQSLRWITAAAQTHGWSLSLYGRGWQHHPEFAPFARGPVEYGPPLQALNRRTKINLQVLPSFCLHPRMIDGLVAGGFFLVRHHPADTLLPQVARHILQHPTASSADVLRALPAAECFTELGQPIDLVAWVRSLQGCGLLDERGDAVPQLADVTFTDQATFIERVQRFLGDEPERRRIADAQRLSVESRLTYTAGLRRATAHIARLIADERPG